MLQLTSQTQFSADGKRLVHKADLKLDRCTLLHDIGVSERQVISLSYIIEYLKNYPLLFIYLFCRYNVIFDLPLTIDIPRLIKGGP